MRRRKALWLTILTGALVLLLALGFALVQHPGEGLEDVPDLGQAATLHSRASPAA
ncbi:MAG: hypothetical protein ACK4K7_09280 [Allosphingosinicella sp.]|uniref:hypothetical protein n=1 Tax=Allosphingosinicella sp. TaxID=2823234 RepID=UPI003922FF54